MESVDPIQLGLKIKRINLISNNSIALEADNIDIDILHNSTSLLAVGLEVKPENKLHPRIIIHDVPVEYDEEVILRSVIELNLPDFTLDDIKMIYMYPARDKKKHRSCVIEIKPEFRKALESAKRLYISW